MHEQIVQASLILLLRLLQYMTMASFGSSLRSGEEEEKTGAQITDGFTRIITLLWMTLKDSHFPAWAALTCELEGLLGPWRKPLCRKQKKQRAPLGEGLCQRGLGQSSHASIFPLQLRLKLEVAKGT